MIVTEHFILVIGIYPPFQITESEFQLTDLPFNLVDNRGRSTWVVFILSSFLAHLTKSGLSSRTQIFVILIREIMVRHMSTSGYLLGSLWWSLVSTPSYLASLATMASSTAYTTSASTSIGNFRDITENVVHTLPFIDVV